MKNFNRLKAVMLSMSVVSVILLHPQVGYTAPVLKELVSAIERNDVGKVRAVLSLPNSGLIDFREPIYEKPNDCNVFVLAAVRGNAEIVREIVKFTGSNGDNYAYGNSHLYGEDPDRPYNEDSQRLKTPLMAAAEAGRTAVVETLLNSGANPDYCDKNGNRPLSLAAKNGHAGIVEMLLKRGVDPDQFSNEAYIRHDNSNYLTNMRLNPLQWAVSMGNVEAVKALLEGGANVNPQGMPLLILLYRTSRNPKTATEIAQLLVKHGVDVNAKCIGKVWFFNLSCQDSTPMLEIGKSLRRDEISDGLVKILFESGRFDFKKEISHLMSLSGPDKALFSGLIIGMAQQFVHLNAQKGPAVLERVPQSQMLAQRLPAELLFLCQLGYPPYCSRCDQLLESNDFNHKEDPMVDLLRVGVTMCGHAFCLNCAGAVFGQRQSCQMCRSESQTCALCPTCGTHVDSSQFYSLHIPAINTFGGQAHPGSASNNSMHNSMHNSNHSPNSEGNNGSSHADAEPGI